MRELIFSARRPDFRVDTFRSGGPGGQEEWAILPDYPDYAVSATGLVVSFKHGKVRELKQQTDSYGYRHVGLVANGRQKGKTEKVHLLVARAFIGPLPQGYHCCHNDGCLENNSLENLRYDTPHGNMNDTMKHGRFIPPRGERNGQAKVTWDKVRYVRHQSFSPAEAAQFLGISKRQSRDILQGKAWKDEDTDILRQTP